ncbi:hypothetical protein [Mariniblastus fucicola]|uniref:Uncharacterized protein n=1 Tax=Mariniblastus fucicola TaxID=980251 RepID=A0A5B9PBG0_9BACT|nr:hypothetical protein [Mariniblastus fucicola]QEG22272.1 hypothetical protein MFFC18_21480 [Mariniblastus fucicola]
MHDWMLYLAITFGSLIFFAHLVWMLYSLQYTQDRDRRLECFGKIVPGLAGICIVFAALAQNPFVSVALGLAGGIVLILGRAVYELIVFGGNGDQ